MYPEFVLLYSMELTIPYVKERIAYFNQSIFAEELPPIEVKLTTAKTFLAKCTFKIRRNLFGKVRREDFCLRINRILNLTPDEIDDVIIHEMIHYYIGYKGMRDSASHGKVFRRMMYEINHTYHRHITISHKNIPDCTESITGKPVKWHVVAAVSMNDGRMGIKVLPRITQRIYRYYILVRKSPEVSHIDLFLAKHPILEQYPNSSALKIHYIEPQKLKEVLKDAERLQIINEREIRKIDNQA